MLNHNLVNIIEKKIYRLKYDNVLGELNKIKHMYGWGHHKFIKGKLFYDYSYLYPLNKIFSSIDYYDENKSKNSFSWIKINSEFTSRCLIDSECQLCNKKYKYRYRTYNEHSLSKKHMNNFIKLTLKPL